MHHMIRQAAARVRRAIDARGSAFAPVLPSDLAMLRTLAVPPAPSPREARKLPPERPVHVLATELEALLDAARGAEVEGVTELGNSVTPPRAGHEQQPPHRGGD